ncbi:9766_t:CDS:2, partial [Gigaspora margarita]
IIETDNPYHSTMQEAAQFKMPSALRRLFAIILIFGEPGDVRNLWNENFNAMSEDFIKRGIPSCQSLINAVLLQIKDILEQHGKNLSEYDLPLLNLSDEQIQEQLSKLLVDDNLYNNYFTKFLLNIGNGTEPTIKDNMICIPDNMVIPWKDETSLQSLIEYVYSDCPNYYTYFAS